MSPDLNVKLADARPPDGDGLAAPSVSAPVGTPNYAATIHSDPATLPADFCSVVRELERTLEMPVWLLVQHDGEKFDEIDDELSNAFLSELGDATDHGPMALLLDSPGGYSDCAYRIATYFGKRTKNFTVIVPRVAKSAATLLALGAHKILLGHDAELGPLDAQIYDSEREEYISALDEVQTLDRLHAFSMESFDRTMFLLKGRTHMRTATLVPMVLQYAANVAKPLLEKIDAVHYTQMSRILKVAEEYARRLLLVRYPEEVAVRIARHLVEKYPEHGFVIDAAEAVRIKEVLAADAIHLKIDLVESVSNEHNGLFRRMLPHLGHLTAIGQLKEIKP
jgi:hypothetical protein